jgi:hypothetical protein
LHRFPVTEDPNLFILEDGESSEVIKSHDMIAMSMSENYSVQVTDSLTQTLLSKIGPGIDHQSDFMRSQ